MREVHLVDALDALLPDLLTAEILAIERVLTLVDVVRQGAFTFCHDVYPVMVCL